MYLFKIGFFELRIYSLMYIIALFVGIKIAQMDYISRKRSLDDKKTIEDFAFICLFSGLIGARIYYVLLRWEFYKDNLSEIIKVWHGGLAIHGGIIGGIIAIFIYSKIKRVDFFALTDLAVSPLILGQALGRLGNLANGEIHGVPTFTPLKVIFTNTFSKWWSYYQALPIAEQAKFKPLVPWGIVFPSNTPAGIEFPSYPLHPAMIYEAILNLMAFLILYFVIRKKEYNKGILSMVYLIFYAVIRIFVSTFRAEDLMIFNIRAPYIISIIMIIFSIFGIIYIKKLNE